MEHSPDRQRAALVTGSARRLGRHLAQRLVADGWRVIVHASDASRAAATAEEIAAHGSVGADLRDIDACARLIDEAVEQLGGELDLLVNCAASFVRATPQHTTPEQWAEAFDVNARAPMLLTARAAPVLARSDDGVVVNISDHAAHEHWATRAAHSASKAALESLTLSTAKALAPEVRVVGISPGPVLAPDDADAELLTRLAARGRTGTPDDVADALVALARGRARTGEIVVLHGRQ